VKYNIYHSNKLIRVKHIFKKKPLNNKNEKIFGRRLFLCLIGAHLKLIKRGDMYPEAILNRPFKHIQYKFLFKKRTTNFHIFAYYFFVHPFLYFIYDITQRAPFDPKIRDLVIHPLQKAGSDPERRLLGGERGHPQSPEGGDY